MKTTAYRIQRVLRGDSTAAAIVAVDTEGREVRLEVGRLEGSSVSENEVLILSWATVQVPGLVTEASFPAADGEDEQPLPDRPMTETELAADSEADDEAQRAVEEFKEITALMGLA